MAALTVSFEVTVDIEVPDEQAARMTLSDVCDTVDFAATSAARHRS